MLSMAVNGYLAADVLYALRGVRGSREHRFRYELLSSTNTFVANLTNVLSGHIKQDAEAEITRFAKFSVVDDGSINFVNQRIKIWAGIRMSDGGFAEWPLGIFLLTSPTRKVDISGVLTREVDGYDQSVVLRDDTVTDRYYISNNYLYTDAINELLASAVGIGTYSITASTLRTPSALDWDPGTSKYKIIADLLAAINYTAIWFDGTGVARAAPYVSPSAASSTYTYATDQVSVVLPEASQTIDLYGVPNRWVLVVSTPDRPVLRSVRTNTSAGSLLSTVSRGRTITKVVTDEEAVNQAVLDARADRMMEEDSLIYSVVEFDTGIMPVHEFMDIIDVNYGDLQVNAKHQELQWSMDLEQGASMKHMVRVAVTL